MKIIPSRRTVLAGLVFLIGFSIAIYPLISRTYYARLATQEVAQFEEIKKDMTSEEVKRRMALADAYNQILDPSELGDPYTDEEKEGIAEYARMLEIREKIGHVEIPRIKADIPIYAGTSEEVLQKGAGHMEGTSLPIGGIDTHTVITAHRGLPSAKLFTDLDKLEVGDRFYIHNLAGVLAYRVDQIITVEPYDFDPVLVVENKDYATLLTCTPIMINSHRLLVRGERVAYTSPAEERHLSTVGQSVPYKPLFFVTLGLLILLSVRWFIRRRRNRNHET